MTQALEEIQQVVEPKVRVLTLPKDSLAITVIKTENEFDRLKGSWDELVRTSDCTIFQTFEWQRTWWKYFKKNRILNCVVFKDNSRVVAIAPMFLEESKVLGLRTVRILKFITCEESDYLDLIIAEGYRELAIRSLVDYLYSSSSSWDVFEMSEVSERFPTFKQLASHLEGRGFEVFTYRGNVCPQIVLPGTWDEFLTHLGGNMRYQLRKKADRLKRLFSVEVEVAANDEISVEAALREFADIHGHRWESLGYKNAFRNDRILAFHVEAAQRLAKRGWLRIFFLKVDGQKVAVNIDFNFRQRIYFYHGNAYGPDEIMKFSPGFLLRCAAIKEGISERMKVYDMLRGGESYKMNDFKCVPVANWQIRAVVPDGGHISKFRLYLLRELTQKIPKRMQRDMRDCRRFFLTKNPTPLMAARFVGEKFAKAVEILIYYVNRFRTR